MTLFNPVKAITGKGEQPEFHHRLEAAGLQILRVVQPDREAEVGDPGIDLVLAILRGDRDGAPQTLVVLVIGLALVTLLLLAGLSLGRITFLNQAAGGGFNREAAAAVWDTVLRFLKTDLRWELLLAVLVALGAWLAGPARFAVWIRSTCAKGGRSVGARAHAFSAGAGEAAAGSERARRTGVRILEHLNGLRIFGVIVAGLFLVFGGNLTGWGLLVIVIVLAVYLVLLQLVAAWAHKVSGSTMTSGTA